MLEGETRAHFPSRSVCEGRICECNEECSFLKKGWHFCGPGFLSDLWDSNLAPRTWRQVFGVAGTDGLPGHFHFTQRRAAAQLWGLAFGHISVSLWPLTVSAEQAASLEKLQPRCRSLQFFNQWVRGLLQSTDVHLKEGNKALKRCTSADFKRIVCGNKSAFQKQVTAFHNALQREPPSAVAEESSSLRLPPAP